MSNRSDNFDNARCSDDMPGDHANEIASYSSVALSLEVARQTYPAGALYVLATPIGNVGDITLRALNVLAIVDIVACEDTRNTAHLLSRYGLRKTLLAAHQHNECEIAQKLIHRLQAGQRIALVSDAGTPGVSDPGARIVQAVHAAGLRIIPIPGASAAVAALCAAGMPETQFHFVGFLPAKAVQRDHLLNTLHGTAAAMVFYEAPHRISEMIGALQAHFEPTREVVFARELTKLFEEVHRCQLDQASDWLRNGSHREKGEYVVVLAGRPANIASDSVEADRVLTILMAACPLKQAAMLAAQITGQKKNALYERALQLKDLD